MQNKNEEVVKKLLFLITVNLLVIQFMSAQTSFYAMDISQSTGDNAIVRSWDNGNAAITYYEVGLKRYVQEVKFQNGKNSTPRNVDMICNNP